MPVYEFYCKKCDEVFDYLVIGKSDIPECPKCGNKNVTKQFSIFGFGSGGKTAASGSVSGCSSCGTHNCGACH